MTGLQFIKTLSKACGGFLSKERDGIASGSEMKRWMDNKSIYINGEPIGWREEMDFDMESVTLFPKGNTISM